MLKRLVVTGLLFSGMAGAGLALAATLNGFEIHTDAAGKEVEVTLDTSQQLPVSTEKSGKQFSIVIDNAQLSQEQLDKGLPVVIDNQNKFIGRAVPLEGGKIKVIIPNLPTNDYDVSVTQKFPGGQATATIPKRGTTQNTASIASNDASPALRNVASPYTGSSLQPRPSADRSSQFERIAKQFPEPEMPKKSTTTGASPVAAASAANDIIRISPLPTGVTGVGAGAIQGGYPIWNPYVVPPSEQPPMVYNGGQQTRKVVRKKVPVRPDYNEPVNTLSMEELQRIRDSRAGSGSSTSIASSDGSDPLSVLHAIPPFGDSFNGIPDLTNVPVAGQTASVAASQQPLISIAEIKSLAQRLPWWVYAIGGAFFIGIGLFTLIGTLVLLKMLFAPSQRPLPNAVPGWGQQVNIPNQVWSHAPIGVASPDFPMAPPEPEPEPLPASVSFEDTAAVNPFEYFKDTPSDVKSAVHNTILLKFPNDPKRRRLSATDEPPRPKKRRRPSVAVL